MTVKACRQPDNQGHTRSSVMVRRPGPPGQGYRHDNVAYNVVRRTEQREGFGWNSPPTVEGGGTGCARTASTLSRLEAAL